MRSLTRDPGLANPAAVPPWTIFLQTLIHDFDTLLWLNPGAEPVEVFAMADALVAPDFKAAGLLDTAVVVITFDNGARAIAEASFSAAYGYDVRGEVFGSAGMVTAGDGARSSAAAVHRGRRSARHRPWRRRVAARRLHGRVRRVRRRRRGEPVRRTSPADDARRALAIALACIDSVQNHAPVARRRGPDGGRDERAVHPGGLRRDGVHRPAVRSTGSGASTSWASRSRSGTGPSTTSTRWSRRGATFSSMTGYVRGNLTDADGADELLATAEQSIPVAPGSASPG